MKRYSVYITAQAFTEIKGLPGNLKQRVKREVDALANDPRPSISKVLKIPESDFELRRIRLDRWRIVYAIVESDHIVDVLAVRKRPPYNYEDLDSLIRKLA